MFPGFVKAHIRLAKAELQLGHFDDVRLPLNWCIQLSASAESEPARIRAQAVAAVQVGLQQIQTSTSKASRSTGSIHLRRLLSELREKGEIFWPYGVRVGVTLLSARARACRPCDSICASAHGQARADGPGSADICIDHWVTLHRTRQRHSGRKGRQGGWWFRG
jgi:hypothetical protein